MINRILVPTDFSISARHAFLYAIEINRFFGARLQLLHVMQDFTDFSEFNLSPSILPQLYAEFEENASERMEEMVSTCIPAGTVCDTYILHGIPFHEIVTFAQDEKTDLIIIGSRGRTGLQHMIFGSTAEKVVKKASCPVLVIKHPEQLSAQPTGSD